MAFAEEFVKFKSPEIIMKEALLVEVEMCLLECTKAQREFFHDKVYPRGINMKSTSVQLMQAVDLLHRTLAKNRAGRLDGTSEQS